MSELEYYKQTINEVYQLLRPAPCSITQQACAGCTAEWTEAVLLLEGLVQPFTSHENE